MDLVAEEKEVLNQSPTRHTAVPMQPFAGTRIFVKFLSDGVALAVPTWTVQEKGWHIAADDLSDSGGDDLGQPLDPIQGTGVGLGSR
jgi:hypothetical protein